MGMGDEVQRINVGLRGRTCNHQEMRLTNYFINMFRSEKKSHLNFVNYNEIKFLLGQKQ